MSLLYPKENPLFSNFKATAKLSWLEQLSSDLASKNYDKLMLGEKVDGIEVYPFYAKEDIAQDFINYRIFSDKAYTHQSWEFQEPIELNRLNERQANVLALQALAEGTEALYFDCSSVTVLPDIPVILQAIIPEGVTMSWKLPLSWPANHWGVFKSLYGTIHLNPLEDIFAKGQVDEKGLDLLSNLLNHDLPNLKKLSVNGQQFANSGASVIKEVALTCNLLVAYLDILTDRGHSAQDLFHTLEISLATRSAYYIDIAKYRAMQLLLHQLSEAYGVEHATQFPIRAVSSTYNKSAYDVHVNMLRNTSEAMAAVIGGCKTISILPHTAQSASESAFARRIARNVSHILRHEAHLDLVQDAVAGSYALEKLTRQVAEQAWDYFLEVEKEGGILKAFEKGKVQKDITQYASDFLHKAGSRQKVFIGANRYADPSVHTPSAAQFLESDTQAEVSQSLGNINGPAVIEGIRFKIDQAVALGKNRPKVGLMRINEQAKSAVLNARFSFLQDLFASVGVSSEKFTDAFLSLEHPSDILSGLDGLVLVSDDEQYAALTAEELKEAILAYSFPCMLAGYPEPIVNARESYGIYAFIHWGMYLPDFAHTFLKDIKFGTDEA
ncbi:methylmalonyl-CoA mutase family protein [Catalinimonas niigatensis]|uniref:methylmalonyl-CoA mutase family protein n=1 Tax=Catalinimonas niigatensis TaxID=1397264 RepID=UPI0026671CBD|nr:methylmalonyl-CoA mutase family protein [Catalinimonas niigatensis]WPP49912.1 methylmalonyl-CoA mutase family protein [Catalinimonas niigatensis]